MKKFTLSDIKAKNKRAGGHFFDLRTMQFFGDTIRSLRVQREGCTIYVVRPKKTSKGVMPKRWKWSTKTGRFGVGEEIV